MIKIFLKSVIILYAILAIAGCGVKGDLVDKAQPDPKMYAVVP